MIPERTPEHVTTGPCDRPRAFKSITSPNSPEENDVVDIHTAFWSFLLVVSTRSHMSNDLRLVSDKWCPGVET